MNINRIGIMQITDTLALGGLERVAVNVANCLPCDRYRSFLGVTRAEGPLKRIIAPHVEEFFLKRTGRFRFGAARRLANFIKENKISILHAHGTSLFFSSFVLGLVPGTALIWHDHFGRYTTQKRPAWIYRLAATRLDGVIAVNNVLAQWSRNTLHVPASRVWYVPNFVCESPDAGEIKDLPGTAENRIVCVANFRPEKDHINLLAAMEMVLKAVPQAHLVLVGAAGAPEYQSRVESRLSRLGSHATCLGVREDVSSVVKSCAIGVLSSVSEGLPLALIEYGMAARAVVATRVGQCAEVLDNGAAGVLVPPSDPPALAAGIIGLLQSPARCEGLGEKFAHRVRSLYSAASVLDRVCAIYDSVLGLSEKHNEKTSCPVSQ